MTYNDDWSKATCKNNWKCTENAQKLTKSKNMTKYLILLTIMIKCNADYKRWLNRMKNMIKLMSNASSGKKNTQ